MVPGNDFNLDVGLRIRELRELLHMSREQFSEQCDISPSFLSAVENGRKSITSKTIYKMCTAFHISADYLIFGRDEDYETDIVIEMLHTINPQSRAYAVQILRNYIDAVNALGKDNDTK
jgi:transcriptional regulator with XRE-family HTH domain